MPPDTQPAYERTSPPSTSPPPPDELAQLEPIAAQVTGDRYPDVTGTSTAREARASLQPCHLSA